MRKYFLVAETPVLNENGKPRHYSVIVTDNPRLGTVLMEFEAHNYDEANKMFSFCLYSHGERKYFSV